MRSFRYILPILLSVALLPFAAYAQSQNGLLGTSLPKDFRAFSDTSPWNSPIGPNPEIDSASAAMIANLHKKTPGLKADLTEWSIPLFVIDSAQCPKASVKIISDSDHLNPAVDPDGNGTAENLPMPEGVWADPQEDGHMVLVDPKLAKSWDFSCAKKVADKQWSASRVDVWDLHGPGYREPFTGDYWWTYGARGSGTPLLGGLVRPEEIEAGEIRHALAFACPVNRKSIMPDGPAELCSPPASRTDGLGIGPEFIPEGARLQLDPALDLDSLGLSPASKVVAKALQKYGMYDCDNADFFKLYMQNLGPDGGKWRNISDFKDLAKIPVERFRVLKGKIALKL